VSEVLRIVTLNAATLFQPYARLRHLELIAWLGRLDPDVVCLQETWEDADHANTGSLIAEEAAGVWYSASHGRPLPTGASPVPSLRFGSTIMSRWPVDETNLIELVAATVEDSMPSAYRMPMSMVHVKTCGLNVFSTHLAPPPSQGHLRVKQVQQIDREIRARTNGRDVLPPVLCGDFNAEPDSDEIRFLSGLATVDGRSTYYQEAWRAAGRQDPGWTWDGDRNPLAAGAQLPPKRIDFVFVGDAYGRHRGGGKVLSATLAFDLPMTGILASDHFGVVVDVRWPDKPPHPS
jgi:endonuclease/exonuclease/phosphatase family metal-dependent hydrolase